MGITKPPSYEHPRKRKRQTAEPQRQETATVDVASTGSAGVANKKKREKGVATIQINAKKDEQLRLVVYPPVSGQLPLYDEMIETGFSPNKALLGLLKKGFAKFETELLTGKVKVSVTKLETSGNPVETTRNVSAEFLKLTRDTFDPFGVLSHRALGQRVAEVILQSVGKAGLND